MIDWGGVVRIYRESIAVLGVSLVAGIFSGTVLGSDVMVAGFQRYPGLLLLLPAFLATRGNVYGALGARIASGLHQGLIDPGFDRDRRLVNAVIASFVNGISISVFIGVLSWVILRLLGRESAALSELVAITLISGTLTAVVMIFGLLGLIFLGYERGIDPDNLVGPIVTTFGDVFGVVFLYIAIVTVDVIL